MMKAHKAWLVFAALNGFSAVAMGAVAAHALADGHATGLAEKASHYQLLHAVLLVALTPYQGKWFDLARWALAAGFIFFCGALYVRALSDWVAVTQMAPIGGIAFMAAWILIAVAAYRDNQN